MEETVRPVRRLEVPRSEGVTRKQRETCMLSEGLMIKQANWPVSHKNKDMIILLDTKLSKVNDA